MNQSAVVPWGSLIANTCISVSPDHIDLFTIETALLVDIIRLLKATYHPPEDFLNYCSFTPSVGILTGVTALGFVICH